MEKEKHMKKQIGLWIDHREATIVTLTDDGEEIKHILSNNGNISNIPAAPIRKPGRVKRSHFRGPARPYVGNHLNKFYDEVIEYIRTADSIQIFRPG